MCIQLSAWSKTNKSKIKKKNNIEFKIKKNTNKEEFIGGDN